MIVFGIIFVLIGIILFAVGGAMSGTILEMYPFYIRFFLVRGFRKPAYFAAWVIFIAGLILVLMHFLDKPLKNYRQNKERHLRNIGKKLCGKCSFTLDINDEFCEKCGAKQETSASFILSRFCHICGEALGAKASFCKKCGNAVLNYNGNATKKTNFMFFLVAAIFSIFLGSVFTFINLWDFFVYGGIRFSEITNRSADNMFAISMVSSFVEFFVNQVIPIALGICVILFLEKKKLIKASSLKIGNLLVPFVMYVMWLFLDNALINIVAKYFSNSTVIMYSLANSLSSLLDIKHVWFWLCIIFYLLIKSGTLNMTRRKILITLGSLVTLCMIAVLFFTYPGILDIHHEYASSSSSLAKLMYIDKLVIYIFMFLFAVYSAEELVGNVTGAIIIIAQITMDFFGIISYFGHKSDLFYIYIVLSHIIITLFMCLVALIKSKKKKPIKNNIYKANAGYHI